METQAQEQAPAQAQEPVHRVHEEEALIGRLTKFVSENPDNDPHKGTDMEAPPAEEKAAEKTEAPEAETVEFDEETPIFDIEYKTENGKESKKLSLKEMREGWMAKQDYHRNIQKVKAQEAQLNQKVQEAALQEQQKYAQEIEKHKQFLLKVAAPELQGVDLNKLAQTDPAEAQRIFFKQIQLNQALQAIDHEQRQVQEKFVSAQKQALAKAVEESRQTLSSDIKGWSDEMYGTVLKGVSQEYGIPAEEVAQVVDARVIKVFHDAFQYRQLQKAKPEIEKKVVAVPKVVKPGSADKPNPAAEAVEDARKRVKKSGDWRDAAEWYLQQQEQKSKGK